MTARSFRVALLALVAFAPSACRPRGTPAPSDALPSGAVPVPATAPLPVVSAQAAVPAPAVVPVADAPKTFADLTSRCDNAVVFVKTVQMQTGATGRRRVLREGVGSGFVFDPDGLILTNNHVVRDSSQITVTLANKRELVATVVGADPPTDVAVLRVAEKGLSHLPLGDSDRSRVGDWVIAIGNPFGLSHTVSAGIISAKGRTREVQLDPTGYYDFLQTDASINPGNSGGPLIDMTGSAIGINTAIRAQANSIGFAIPINMVKELVPRLVKDGKVKRGAIGISVSSVLEEDVARLHVSGAEGALVRQVLPGGAGDRAGLQVDDVIVAFDGQPVTFEKLRWLASLAGPGKAATLRVRRGARVFDLAITLGELQVPTGSEPDEDPDPHIPGIP